MKKSKIDSYINNLKLRLILQLRSAGLPVVGFLLPLLFTQQTVAATPYCSDIFQNGLQTHGIDGTVNFQKNSRLINPYSTRLNTPTVTIDITSTLKSCGSQHCAAAGISVDGLTIDKKETWSTWNFFAPAQQTTTLGENQITYLGHVQLDSKAIAVFVPSDTHYTIDRLTLGSGSTLRLPTGDYWVSHFSAQSNAKIEVIGEGPVTFYVQNDFILPLNFKINENTKDPSRISIYTFGKSEYAAGSRVFAFIRSQTSATLKNKAQINGGLLANSITLESASIVAFDSAALKKMSFNYFCSGFIPFVDVTPPTINFINPYRTGESKLTLTGTIKDPGGIKSAFFRHGDTTVPATLVNENFTVELPLEIGPNLFFYSVTDDAGNVTSGEFEVWRESIPGFSFSFDAFELYTARTKLNVTGTINLPDGHFVENAFVQTASGEFQLRMDGNRFSVVVPVISYADGVDDINDTNKYIFIAYDQFGNKTVELMDRGGSAGVELVNIQILPTSVENIREVTGEVHSFWQSNDLVGMLNGASLQLTPIADGISIFKANITLQDGKNRIEVFVKAPNEEYTYIELYDFYFQDRINIEITSPDMWSGIPNITSEETMLISGWLHLPKELIGVVTGIVVTSDQIPGVEIPIDWTPNEEHNSTFSVEVPLAMGDNNLRFKTKKGNEDLVVDIGWPQVELLITRVPVE